MRWPAAGCPRSTASGSATENVLSENGQIPVGQIPGFTRDFTHVRSRFRRELGIDFWGRRTRQVEAASARVEAADAARQDVMLTLDRRGRARLYRSARRAGGHGDRDGHGERRCGGRAADLAPLQRRRSIADRGGSCRGAGADQRRRCRECPVAGGGRGVSHRHTGRRTTRGDRPRAECAGAAPHRARCHPDRGALRSPRAPSRCPPGGARACRGDRGYRRRDRRSVSALQPVRRRRTTGADDRRSVLRRFDPAPGRPQLFLADLLRRHDPRADPRGGRPRAGRGGALRQGGDRRACPTAKARSTASSMPARRWPKQRPHSPANAAPSPSPNNAPPAAKTTA